MCSKINVDLMNSLKKLSLVVYKDNFRGASWFIWARLGTI